MDNEEDDMESPDESGKAALKHNPSSIGANRSSDEEEGSVSPLRKQQKTDDREAFRGAASEKPAAVAAGPRQQPPNDDAKLGMYLTDDDFAANTSELLKNSVAEMKISSLRTAGTEEIRQIHQGYRLTFSLDSFLKDGIKVPMEQFVEDARMAPQDFGFDESMLEMKQKIEHIETMMIESKTVEKDMSKANTEFATDLLTGLSISWRATDANMNEAVGSAVGNFEWDHKLLKGGKAKMSENDGTPAALEWLFGKLEQGLAVDGKVLGIRDGKGKKLAPIKADRKEATGKSDGCIAEESKLVLCERTQESFYTYGMALVEMKTNRRPMNKAQMLLQLAAFSRQSTWGQSTVLLGTDGNAKWYLIKFEAFNRMSLTQYSDGRQCLNELESLLKSLETRRAKLRSSKRAKLGPVWEEQLEVEQHLTEISSPAYASLTDAAGGSQEAVDKAIENEALLHRLANALAESPLSDGVRPSLPEWSLAKNVVPSYYT